MGEKQGGEPNVAEQLSAGERHMTEVYNLMANRLPDGSHDPLILRETFNNLVPGVKEAAMPLAISSPYQQYRDGNFMWLDGQTPEMVAASGYRYHKHSAALARVAVEVDEARHTSPRMLKPGFLKLMISPAMTETDAPVDVAREEHLADNDIIRLHQLDTDERGDIRGKYMPTAMLPVVPLPAWHAALNDLGSKIDKQFNHLTGTTSALPIMELHRELEFPARLLPDGLITVVEHLLPHLADTELRLKLEEQLLMMRDEDAQTRMHKKAESIARRWLDFEVGLADSLLDGRATPIVEQFVYSLQHQWDAEALQLIWGHSLVDGGLMMTKPLAMVLEKARQNTLWTSAGVAVGNQAVLAQLDAKTAQAIYENDVLVDIMSASGYSASEIAAIESRNNRIIAEQGIQVGGGCGGVITGNFSKKQDKADILSNPLLTEQEREQLLEEISSDDEQTSWAWKPGVCRVESCYTRPGQTQVGPCAVCRGCQKLFDMGIDPTKRPAPRPRKGNSQESLYLLDFLIPEKEAVDNHKQLAVV